MQQVRLRQKELSAARADLPLHVFGVGQPDTVRAIFAAGATSCDASSCQRQAASGKSWGMDSIGDASPLERLHLAVASLKVLNEAAETSAAHS